MRRFSRAREATVPDRQFTLAELSEALLFNVVGVFQVTPGILKQRIGLIPPIHPTKIGFSLTVRCKFRSTLRKFKKENRNLRLLEIIIFGDVKICPSTENSLWVSCSKIHFGFIGASYSESR